MKQSEIIGNHNPPVVPDSAVRSLTAARQSASRLGRRLEQRVVDRGLVVEYDVRNREGQHRDAPMLTETKPVTWRRDCGNPALPDITHPQSVGFISQCMFGSLIGSQFVPSTQYFLNLLFQQ
jgi:hypothetical protein